MQNPWTYVLLLLHAVLSACYLCCSVDVGALGKEVFHDVEMTTRCGKMQAVGPALHLCVSPITSNSGPCIIEYIDHY